MSTPAYNKPIGRVVGTERKPNTAFTFNFWCTPDTPVGIGTIVVVRSEGRTVWGVVTEGFGYNDLETPIYDFIGSDGVAESEMPTLRPEMRLYVASVLRQMPEEPVQPAPIAPVYLADAQDVRMALRMDAFASRAIPIGVYRNGEALSPITLDSRFLLGPEAGHLNVTGTSGLAAKTSAIMFLLQAIFQKLPSDESVAALLFNVKGADLMFIDLPPGEDFLTEQDRRMYDVLGVQPKPFERVFYYAPFKGDRVNLNTLRSHPDLRHNVLPLHWGLREVLDYTEVMLNRDDIDVKADAFLQFIKQRAVDPGKFEFDKEEQQAGAPPIMPVTNFAELSAWLDTVLRVAEARGREAWRSHAYPTIRKVYNRLSNLTTRYRGLIGESGFTSDLPDRFEDRTVYVIDVSQLEQEEQDLIITRVIAELRKRMESHRLGVDHLIVVVDELNKYAPSFGKETYMLRTLLDITERGRYLGLVLFGAQQFRSQVERRVAGNCATSLYGRIEMEELAQPGYSVFGQAVKEKLAACEPGEVLVRHPHFTQPIFVRFPRPCFLRGSEGIRRYPPQEKPFDVAVWEVLRDLDPTLEYSQVKAVIDDVAAYSNGLDEERVSEAMHRVLLERPEPSRVLERFRAHLPKPVQSSTFTSSTGLMGPAFNPAAGDGNDPNDPFAGW
ncbi:MAG: ATP-binding protein [Armatimonadetes bacterium]|nr:ATP-binding protein [Armatimonadota bacterium]